MENSRLNLPSISNESECPLMGIGKRAFVLLNEKRLRVPHISTLRCGTFERSSNRFPRSHPKFVILSEVEGPAFAFALVSKVGPGFSPGIYPPRRKAPPLCRRQALPSSEARRVPQTEAKRPEYTKSRQNPLSSPLNSQTPFNPHIPNNIPDIKMLPINSPQPAKLIT
jgi:hypothetical protein